MLTIETETLSPPPYVVATAIFADAFPPPTVSSNPIPTVIIAATTIHGTGAPAVYSRLAPSGPSACTNNYVCRSERKEIT